jgi:serine/threonine-protein kinase
MIGRTVSHFRIQERLGEGGMGVVYRAEDTRLHRPVALKFLRPHLLAGEEARARLFREARAAAALDHPHICTVYQIDEADGQIFIIMALIEGQSLKARLAAGSLSLQEVRRITLQTASALAAAHAKGIIHRDIKPGNLMLTAEGQVKILDFGLARTAEQPRITQEGTTAGTVAYMSPEQARGEEVDHRADLWSLGVVLYEMLTGRLPFRGEGDQAILYSILNTDPPAPSSLRVDIPEDIERVVLRCLRKIPEERYPDVAELLADLGQPAEASTITLSPTAPREKSIVVLPFVSIPPDPENEWFSDGITEDLITHLAKIGDLKVISRTSAMHYKGTRKKLREIARELRVATVLEGSVRQSGDRLRITAQLIDAQTDSHLWAETFDRGRADIFGVQGEVALRIAETMQAKLSSTLRRQVNVVPTENPRAYALYSKGRYFWNQRSVEGMKKALEYFQQALSQDPNYALAYTGVADVYGQLGIYDALSPQDSFGRAGEAARKALAIDPDLAEAHVSLGWVKTFYEWDWTGAEEVYGRALALTPSSVDALNWYGLFLIVQDRFGEAHEAYRAAKRLDPVNPVIGYTAALAHYFGRDYDLAIEQFREVLDVYPQFVRAHMWLGQALASRGLYDDALREATYARELGGVEDIANLEFLGIAEAIAGRRQEAEQILSQLTRLRGRRYVSPYVIGRIHGHLGREDDALQWFEQAFAIRDHWLPPGLVFEPGLDEMRSAGKLKDLKRRVGLRA